jgi:hypothetical protein
MQLVSLLDRRLFSRRIFICMAALWLLSVRVALGQACLIDGPRYNLTGDTVDWSMQIGPGRTCIRGVRFNNVVIESLEIASRPQGGALTLSGPGFTYTAKPDFSGQDSFSLKVTGAVNQIRGSSTINVAVLVGHKTGRSLASPPRSAASVYDIAPPSISFTEPTDGATVSGSVALTATASSTVAIAQVQFIVAGKNIGPPILARPFTTTWNSTATPDGLHRIYAVAKDISGNYGTSSIRVDIHNTPN